MRSLFVFLFSPYDERRRDKQTNKQALRNEQARALAKHEADERAATAVALQREELRLQTLLQEQDIALQAERLTALRDLRAQHERALDQRRRDGKIESAVLLQKSTLGLASASTPSSSSFSPSPSTSSHRVRSLPQSSVSRGGAVRVTAAASSGARGGDHGAAVVVGEGRPSIGRDVAVSGVRAGEDELISLVASFKDSVEQANALHHDYYSTATTTTNTAAAAASTREEQRQQQLLRPVTTNTTTNTTTTTTTTTATRDSRPFRSTSDHTPTSSRAPVSGGGGGTRTPAVSTTTKFLRFSPTLPAPSSSSATDSGRARTSTPPSKEILASLGGGGGGRGGGGDDDDNLRINDLVNDFRSSVARSHARRQAYYLQDMRKRQLQRGQQQPEVREHAAPAGVSGLEWLAKNNY